MAGSRVPTVHDLRVKLCYICREEEYHDNPQNPPVAWVHPCNCTLVAHESCLLSWIQSAQQDAARAGNALKCPQCGTVYEIESDNPLPLRVLNSLNSSLSVVGRVVSGAGLICIVGSLGFGIYIICTSYGAYAVQEFLGKELYNILLTDDPSNWPWHAFLNLPLIPISLVLSRTRLFDTFPLVPLFLAWTSSPPVPSTQSLMTARWTPPLKATDPYPFAPVINWPPSPIMAAVLFPFVTGLYTKYFAKFRHWVMGTEPTPKPPVRRIVWALNEDGPAQLRVHIGANIEPANQDQQQQANAQGQRGDNQQQQQQQQQEGGQPQDPAEVAERTIRVTGASLGRFIGGALMIPAISNWMGAILFRLSKRSLLLRKILAVRPPRATAPETVAQWFDSQPWGKTGFFKQVGLGLRFVLNVVCGGTTAFAECDPVWWRNSLGLGMFVIAKDCINLLHLYLTKREIETRRVKNRSFAGVDIRELDLIPNRFIF